MSRHKLGIHAGRVDDGFPPAPPRTVPLTASADRRTINHMLSPCELWPAFPIDAGFFYFQAVPQ